MGKVHAFHKSLFCHWLVLITHCQFCPVLMEKNSWSVHSDMETAEKPVQNNKKKRSQSDKIGRLKYNQQLLKQTLAEVEEVKLMLRTIFAGLKGSFNFEQSLIERVVARMRLTGKFCRYSLKLVLRACCQRIWLLSLKGFKVTRHQVSRRILRMNKRLEKEFGEHVVRKERLALGTNQLCSGNLERNRKENCLNTKNRRPPLQLSHTSC